MKDYTREQSDTWGNMEGGDTKGKYKRVKKYACKCTKRKRSV